MRQIERGIALTASDGLVFGYTALTMGRQTVPTNPNKHHHLNLECYMAIAQLEPREAKAVMDEAENAVYLDVRTEMEFAQGHPKGAINIPVAVPGPVGMVPNPNFLNVVQKVLPDKDQPVFCGCQVGMRSQMAAESMARAGYSNLVNVQGGFGGKVENGILVVAGWRDSNLPVETEVNDANSYAGLKARGAKSE